jgi:hypothetical protein
VCPDGLLQPAVFQLNDAAAVGRVGFRTRHLNDGRAGFVQGREQLHDVLALRPVQVAGRLVGQQDLGVLMTARPTATICCWLPESRFGVEAVERVGDQALAILPRHVAVGERHVEVFGDGQVVERVVALEHEAAVLLVQVASLFRCERVDGLSREAVLAAPLGVVHAEDVQERRPARARRSHDGDEFAVRDIERDLPKDEVLRRALRVGLLEVPQGDERDRQCVLIGGTSTYERGRSR